MYIQTLFAGFNHPVTILSVTTNLYSFVRESRKDWSCVNLEATSGLLIVVLLKRSKLFFGKPWNCSFGQCDIIYYEKKEVLLKKSLKIQKKLLQN